jgi:hypothetical protein
VAGEDFSVLSPDAAERRAFSSLLEFWAELLASLVLLAEL